MSLYMQKSYKRAFCCKPLCGTLVLKISQQSINSINFPGHDLISGKEVALGRFPLIFLTDALSLTTPVVWK